MPIYINLKRLRQVIFGAYPSPTCVDGAIAVDCSVLIEVLSHREAHKDREAQYELCSEAIEVAELKET